MSERRQGRQAGRHTTQLDIARAAGVSRSVVSHALNGSGRISQATRSRVLRVARELDYQPHGAASELASRRSDRLVVVLPYLDNPFFDILVRHLRERAHQVGRSLVVLVSDLEADLERATVEEARRMRPAGLILPGTRLASEEIERLGQQVPVCLLDRGLPGSSVTTARMDEDLAAEQIVSHLHGLGHRHLAFLAPATPLYERLVTDRGRACARAARARGMSVEQVTCEAGTLPVLRDRPTPLAVVAYNDLLAINVITAAYHLGRRVGPDIAVASYDNTRLACRPEFDLTSVDQNPQLLAGAAVELLTAPDARSSPAERTATIAPRLVVRSSTGMSS